jgi:hypothetical protein
MVSPAHPRRGRHRWFRRPAAQSGKTTSAARPLPQALPRVRDERVERLLREISELRLSAATHLTIAAAAMDAGRPDIVSELIDAQQHDVDTLRQRAAELLAFDGAEAEVARRSVLHEAVLEESALLESARSAETRSLRKSGRNRGTDLDMRSVIPARRTESGLAPRWSGAGALLAIAATIAIALIRPLAPSAPPDPSVLNASAVASLDANVVRSYDQLQVTAKPKTPRSDVEEAAQRLHADLQRLLPAAAHDPEAAKRLLGVLKAERALLTEQHPSALPAFEAQAAHIIEQLRALASPAVIAVLTQPGSAAIDLGQASDPLPAAAPQPGEAPQPVGSSDHGSADIPPVTSDPGPASNPAPVVDNPAAPQGPADSGPAGSSGSTGGGTDSGASAGTGSGGADTSSTPTLPDPVLPAPPVDQPAP